MVEDSQRDGRFPDSPRTNESDRIEIFGKTDDILDQLVAPKTCSWGWGRGFTRCARCKYERLGALLIKVADLVRVWVTVSVDSAVDMARIKLTEKFLPLVPP